MAAQSRNLVLNRNTTSGDIPCVEVVDLEGWNTLLRSGLVIKLRFAKVCTVIIGAVVF